MACVPLFNRRTSKENEIDYACVRAYTPRLIAQKHKHNDCTGCTHAFHV